MKQEVFLVVLALFSLNILYFGSSENVQLFRYTKVVCSASNISVFNYFCFVRAHSRTLTTMSYGATIIKNYTKAYVKNCFYV